MRARCAARATPTRRATRATGATGAKDGKTTAMTSRERRATTTVTKRRAATTRGARGDEVVVITGANTGLGYETAKAAAKAGRRVVAAVRDEARGERAKTRVLAAVPEAKVDVMLVDLADFESVRAFARAFEAKYDRLDALVNNSGVMAPPSRSETKDGNELQMQVNHLGHFLLTSLLLDTMVNTPSDDKRIVNLSSIAHNFGTLDFHNVNSEGVFGYPFLGWATYGRTKMANIMFTFELDRRLKAKGVTNVAVNAVHPGVVDTELNRSLSLDFYPQLKAAGKLITPEQGARGQIALAMDEKYRGVSGVYVSELSDDGKPGVHEPKRANERAYDAEAWARLWKDSVKLTGAVWSV
jgi:NAD(P)-dependent dehydrogenase (short-subunit alcohol dehydrogenase family)